MNLPGRIWVPHVSILRHGICPSVPPSDLSPLRHGIPATGSRAPHPSRLRLSRGVASTPSNRRRLAHLTLTAALSFIALAALVLYRFPPAASSFYPICPVHEYLHLACPGCGTTRALAALLHGHLAEALHLNPLAILLVLPLVVIYGSVAYARAIRDRDFRWPQLPTPALYAGIALMVAFTVARNL